MHGLKIISNPTDPWIMISRDDPVRPDIAAEHRVGRHGEMLVLLDEQDEPAAVICVKYCSLVPETVGQLLEDAGEDRVAVFYSIWSYSKGAGSSLIVLARKHIEATRPSVSRFVTLSPTTDMARNFHLKNGAIVFRENAQTVNYEYT